MLGTVSFSLHPYSTRYSKITGWVICDHGHIPSQPPFSVEDQSIHRGVLWEWGTKGMAAAAASVLKSFGFGLLFLAVYVGFLIWEPVSPKSEKY